LLQQDSSPEALGEDHGCRETARIPSLPV